MSLPPSTEPVNASLSSVPLPVSDVHSDGPPKHRRIAPCLVEGRTEGGDPLTERLSGPANQAVFHASA